MELQKIKQLLEKYLEGQTSLKEEQRLKQYFCSEKVAPELEEYKLLFGFFKEERQQIPSQKVQLRKTHKRNYLRWAGVAAAVAIIVSVFLFRPEPQQKQWNEIEDPQLALKKTKQVLNTIAQQMNTGKSNLVYLYEVENTANKIINNKPEK